MSTEPVEIEAKVHVADLESIRPLLEHVGAKLIAPRVYERNVRYENAEGTLTSTHRVVRLRQDTRVRLTYKEPSLQYLDGATSRTELEVTISDFAMMDAILGKLGYSPAWLYEKYRTTYEWHDAEIVLDEMPYGNFVEVEGPQAMIEDALLVLGLSELTRIKSSYSDLFFQLKARLGWRFNDLTFDNFRGIVVPEDAFDKIESPDQKQAPDD
ncbi:MAG: class IV adenylate cyclase [Aggregatilineales bacterium]